MDTQPSENTRTDQANSFAVLMEMIWEGGAAYNLNFPGNAPEGAVCEAHNACHMFATMFPASWEKRIERTDEHEQDHFLVTCSDNSSMIIYADGSGIEQL